MKKIALLLLFAMLLQLCACTAVTNDDPMPTGFTAKYTPLSAVNLTAHLTRHEPAHKRPDETFHVNAANLAVQLLQGVYEEGKTCVISPYSVLIALSMAANGANGLTLAQMQDVLGMSVQDCNEYLADMKQKEFEVSTANSLWAHSNLSLEQGFLSILNDYYSADVFNTPFDESTLQDINAWFSNLTGGEIENALQEMHPNAILYLINALHFSALWMEPYQDTHIREGVFYGAQGEETVDMMSSEEHLYLHDETAVGFMKPYTDSPYSYVAILPNGNIEEYLQSLDAETLLNLVENAQETTVFAQMPKHTVETKLELSEVLCNMGMDLAFSDSADFSNMTDTECKLSRVLHQTSLTVDGMGTVAGAVTIEEVVTKGVAIGESVTLDRPFLMGIYDKRAGCFIFLGVINTVS